MPKHPEEYFKWNVKKGHFINTAPACAGCGDNQYRHDNKVKAWNARFAVCKCDGYIHLTRKEWPHRIGSKYCRFREDGTQRVQDDSDWADSQFEEYQKQQFTDEGNNNDEYASDW